MNSSRRIEPKPQSKAIAQVTAPAGIAGRMPPNQQRRLNHLLEKGRDAGLNRAEQRELEQILDDVDRRSFWLLARRMLQRRSLPGAGRGAPHKRAVSGG